MAYPDMIMKETDMPIHEMISCAYDENIKQKQKHKQSLICNRSRNSSP